jgi:hypothetical protein
MNNLPSEMPEPSGTVPQSHPQPAPAPSAYNMDMDIKPRLSLLAWTPRPAPIEQQVREAKPLLSVKREREASPTSFIDVDGISGDNDIVLLDIKPQKQKVCFCFLTPHNL